MAARPARARWRAPAPGSRRSCRGAHRALARRRPCSALPADTLLQNLAEVEDAFTVQRFAMFDQFPYTHHVECGVYLTRRAGAGGQRQQEQQQAGQQGQDGRGVKRKAEEDGCVGAGEGGEA